MMKSALRNLAAVCLGMILAFLLLVGVELFSAVVHPLPADFGGTQEEMCRHVARYPQWVLAVVVPLWAVTAFAGTGICAVDWESLFRALRRPAPLCGTGPQYLDAPLSLVVQNREPAGDPSCHLRRQPQVATFEAGGGSLRRNGRSERRAVG